MALWDLEANCLKHQSVGRSNDNVRNVILQTTRFKNRWGFTEFAKFGDSFVFNDDKCDLKSNIQKSLYICKVCDL